MPRKKKIFAVVAILLLFLGDFLYWTIPFSFEKALPKENWTKAQLWYYDEYFDMREITIDENTLKQIVTSLKGGQVTNRPRSRFRSLPDFELYLYSDRFLTCSINISENGDISVAAELETDRRKHYDGGEELYVMLKNLTSQLPAFFPPL